MDQKLFKEYVLLLKSKKEKKSDLDTINERITALEPLVIEQMATFGIEKITINGMTLFTTEKVFPKYLVDSKDEVIQALKSAGMEAFCPEQIVSQRLASYLQELYDSGDPIPDALNTVIDFNPITKVGKRKAA